MHLATQIACALVALIHTYFLVLEMFLFNRPYGHKTFKLEPDFAAKAATLAANQGLYNGFLVAGIVWGLLAPPGFGQSIETFFLSCVVVAGLYGGFTAGRIIFFFQMLPGLIALAIVRFVH